MILRKAFLIIKSKTKTTKIKEKRTIDIGFNSASSEGIKTNLLTIR